MKTVFLLVTRGLIARNILRTDVFRTLTGRKDIRTVLLVPPGIPDYFRQEFSAPNVVFEEVGAPEYGPIRRVLQVWFQNLVYTDTSKLLSKYGTAVGRHLPRPLYYLENAVFRVLSRFTVLKRLARWIEQHVFPDRIYDPLFRTYAPSLAISTAVLAKQDIALIKSARRFGVPSVGFSRGWDNLDQKLYRARPDSMIVWNDVMKDSLVRFQDFRPDEVFVAGFPQFDIYFRKDIFWSREEHARRCGFAPDRKIVFLGSEGEWSPTDEAVIEELLRMDERGEFPVKIAILVRPHFSDVQKKRFAPFAGRDRVYVDANYRVTKYFVDSWDPSAEDMVWFANSLKHCDLMVTTGSTLALDASMFDKPVVNIAYDPLGLHDAEVKRLYHARHFRPVHESGGAPLVRSREEFVAAVSRALTAPAALAAGRERLRTRLCGPSDGHAGRRIGERLLALIA